jgi:hypothetical protein
MYGDTDLLLYPEARWTLHLSKKFNLDFNLRKYISVNNEFTPDNLFVGSSLSYQL